jgi:hypothetical protein
MKASVIISGKVRHAEGLCNLRCAIIEQNGGYFTLDIGKREAKGDLVIFMDDAIPLGKWIERSDSWISRDIYLKKNEDNANPG